MKKDKNINLKLKKRYKLGLIFLFCLLLFLFYSRYISTSGLIINEYKIKNSNLPIGFHGLKLVHFSDIHFGRTIQKKELKNIVNKINLITPDLVVFTGDLIDKNTNLTNKDKKLLIQELKKIKSFYGKYAVSGNHDFTFQEYNEILKSSDFINIDNDYDIIYNENLEKIFISGLQSELEGKPNLNKILDYIKLTKKEKENNSYLYKIMIMHTPDTYNKFKNINFDLILAGHSHCGQIRLPFIGSLYTPIGAKKYYEPYYKINNTDFFISCGLGVSEINFRLFNKPSLNFYRLTTK
ncbi:MAG: metallophosphoesterase [Bacilli bacterium]|jgi:predicted MPP superfamily phosphohydrolase